METIKLELETYSLDELKEESKEDAIQNMAYINVEDFEWWDFLYEDFNGRLEEIEVSCERFYWSFDRDYYIFMDKPYVSDERKFLKSAGLDLRTKDARDLIESGLSIGTHHYGGGSARNYVSEDYLEEVDLTEYLDCILKGFLRELEDEYWHLTSEESVVETIECNDYMFFEDGSRTQRIFA